MEKEIGIFFFWKAGTHVLCIYNNTVGDGPATKGNQQP